MMFFFFEEVNPDDVYRCMHDPFCRDSKPHSHGQKVDGPRDAPFTITGSSVQLALVILFADPEDPD